MTQLRYMHQIRKWEGTFTNYKKFFKSMQCILYFFHPVLFSLSPDCKQLAKFYICHNKVPHKIIKWYSIPFTISNQCACLNIPNDNEGNNRWMGWRFPLDNVNKSLTSLIYSSIHILKKKPTEKPDNSFTEYIETEY